MSLNLFLHAIRMIVNNLGEALKASVGPMLILIFILILLAGAMGLPLATISQIGMGGGAAGPMDMTQPSPQDMRLAAQIGFFGLIAAVLYLLVFCWIAVTWHRYILLSETPGFITSPTGLPIGGYLWMSIKLALLMIVILIPLGFILGLIVVPLMSVSPVIVGIVLAMVLGAVIGFLWLRLALGLPAAAIGKKLGIGESWSQSKRLSGDIAGVAVLLVLLNLVLGVPGQLAGANLIGAILDMLATWFTLMVGVGILTTLYGHIVENRPLT